MSDFSDGSVLSLKYKDRSFKKTIISVLTWIFYNHNYNQKYKLDYSQTIKKKCFEIETENKNSKIFYKLRSLF